MRLIDADVLMAQVMASFEKLYKSNELLSDYKVNLDNPSFIYRHGIKHYLDTCGNIEFLKAYLDGAPTVDAEPVPHGRWRKVNEKETFFDIRVCTNCEEFRINGDNIRIFKRCPNCGAKMDEVSE